MYLTFAACICALSLPNVTVRPLAGDPVRGELTQLTEKRVVLQTAAGPREFETRTLLRVAQSGSTVPESGEAHQGIWLELVDDSIFPGSSVTLLQGKFQVEMLSGQKLALPSGAVRAVRFHAQDPAVRKQWNSIASERRAGDVLVVRKQAQTDAERDTAGEIVLDQLSGVVHEIQESTVIFEFDGERLNVARTKLEGILFRPTPGEEIGEPACQLRDREGGIWNLSAMRLEQGRLYLVTVAGVAVERTPSQLADVDFSIANVVFLSDLEPETVEWRPYFQSSATPASLSKWFAPRRDRDLDGAPLTLQGESFEKGLALHSRTLLSYRLTRNYRQLAATVGIDERFRAMANLQLVIMGDDNVLLTRSVKGTDEPFDLQLDLQGVRRLKILVDFGEDRSDAGDLLYLCNARLMK